MNEFYFKTLDIPNFDIVLKEIRQYVLGLDQIKWGYDILNLKSFINNNPNFFQFIKEYNLPLKKIAIINIKPKLAAAIHIDYIEPDVSKIALNLSIENCTDNPTKMFKIINNNSTGKITDLGFPYYLFHKTDVECVTEFNLEKPTLFNFSIPHQVVNNSFRRRLSISFRFFKDPVSLM